MRRDTVTKLLASLLALAALTAAAMLAPVIDADRRDRNLVFEPESSVIAGDATARLASTGLGSFNSVVAQALWYRLENQKQEGKFFEAAATADMITTLQPRFPQVWSFQAWNMAYNISVMTQTPDERWDWVSKGIDLLRDKGIPWNPRSPLLYKELGWTFLHKVGGSSDDQHWFYKLKMAQEWENLLGAPPRGVTQREAAARFEPIADMADRYFMFTRPPRDVREALEALYEKGLLTEAELGELREMEPARLAEALPARIAAARDRRPALAQALEPILRRVRDHAARAASGRSALTRFIENHPEAKPALARMTQLGLEPNTATLRQIGQVLSLMNTGAMPQGGLPGEIATMLADPRMVESLPTVLAFLRAQALVEGFHMDPGFMLQLMREMGPLDWRHPASHAAYWSELGIERTGERRDPRGVDLLNQNRQVIHALQDLMFKGRVLYNPLGNPMSRREQVIDYQPDPRFIAAYQRAWEQAVARIEAGDLGGVDPKNLAAGHENFLRSAVLISYFYGEPEEAQRWYEQLKDTYENSDRGRKGDYDQPLNTLAIDLYLEEIGTDESPRPDIAIAAISGLLYRGLGELALGRRAQFDRLATTARRLHERFGRQYGSTQAGTIRDRQKLPPWRDMFLNTAASFLLDPGIDPLSRSNVYRQLPTSVQLDLYGPILPPLRQQFGSLPSLDVDALFPAPPGYVPPEAPAPNATDADTPGAMLQRK